jgi:hypothetical protein
MLEQETEGSTLALQEAARELQAAQHDAQVAFDCIALGEVDRAHTHALIARVAVDAAVTALAAALSQEALSQEALSQEGLSQEGQAAGLGPSS